MIPARRSPAFLRFFDGYVVRLLRRHFHRVHLWGSPAGLEIPGGVPLLLVMSHAAWWDVLVGYYLARHVVRVESYAPMDEAQLRRYRILRRLGIYSVDRFSPAGVRAFLGYTAGLLGGERAVWLTPQGELCSNRRRPVRFQAGVGHLVRRVPRVDVLPVAVAYEFLEEPRPEVFIKFGRARPFRQPRDAPAEIVSVLERDLERELDALLAVVAEGNLEPFSVLLEGATSLGLVYDRLRRLRGWITRRQDPPRHGDVVSDPRKVRHP